MAFSHALAIFAAGVAAGTINPVVGNGTLIIFPVLLSFGYAAVGARGTERYAEATGRARHLAETPAGPDADPPPSSSRKAGGAGA